jgi:hypothetical protein
MRTFSFALNGLGVFFRDSLSTRQREKVDDVFRSAAPDALVASEAFRAMRADVALSGRQAFAATGSLRGSLNSEELAHSDDDEQP